MAFSAQNLVVPDTIQHTSLNSFAMCSCAMSVTQPKKAGLDLCEDEMTWPHSGFGKAKSRLMGFTQGKPGVRRGGQIVVVFDCDRF